jgi:HlyD family secretion protein
MKKSMKWIIALVVVGIVAFVGFKYWKSKQMALPKGIASGNGRIEAKLVDAAAKEPLRVKDVLVNEGDLVKAGQVLVHLDASTLAAQLAEANANVAAAQQQMAATNASIARRKSELELAKIEAERSRKMLEERAGSQREYDVRRMAVETGTAALAEEQAKLETAKQNIQAAQANVGTIQSRISDATLVSPITGRVLYRLAEPGEVLGPGGKALTLVNLQDVYMEIFLPAKEAAALKMGAEARITADFEPDRAAPGYVSFVSPEAQFTPKEVETKSEREKLMFRVKIQIPENLVMHYIEHIKTGMRGVGYVKVDPSAVWPDWLQKNLLTAGAPAQASTPGDTTATGSASPDSGATAQTR